MQGKILDFSIQTNSGIISGDDQKRYPFAGSEWKEQQLPKRGMSVDFDVNEQEQALGFMLHWHQLQATSSASFRRKLKNSIQLLTVF